MSENIPDALNHQVVAATAHVRPPEPEDDALEREPARKQAAEHAAGHPERPGPSTGGSDELDETNGGG
ncbi:MAG: hypothetical protein AB7L17_09210 [Ilumatobacteraceae bacterium]